MKPLHQGKDRIKLYDTSDMVSVSMCLDSGKRATSACGKDARGMSRVASAKVYPEDVVSGYCNKHVSVTLCSGGGVPTEWCEKFAKVDPTVKIETKSLLRMTSAEYNEAAKAVGKGLSSAYISKNGLLLGGGVPDDPCEVHTKEAWETYLASLTTAPPETTAPEGGGNPPPETDPPAGG